jgi:hypothetical protein
MIPLYVADFARQHRDHARRRRRIAPSIVAGVTVAVLVTAMSPEEVRAWVALGLVVGLVVIAILRGWGDDE